MELRNENVEKKRKRKLVPRGPVLVRSVKSSQAAISSYSHENKTLDDLWKGA